MRTKPFEGFTSWFFSVVLEEPAGRFGNEEEAEGDEAWDDVDDAEGEDIGLLAANFDGEVVDYCADEGAWCVC